ncbi:glycosyltransferase [Gaoshiqia sp. Z1-71]|uniref:glycosyltransferase n=1 Tax=Gaoshiqia hydrogeniformans TaxID=3290090 RepID=UPI003BF88821
MNVLMFGWEFPPNISGGLGTACYGLTKSLSSLANVDITFVIPKVHGNEIENSIQLRGANQLDLLKSKIRPERLMLPVECFSIESGLVPYANPEEYQKQAPASVEEIGIKSDQQIVSQINFTGNYGPNLFNEIHNFSVVAEHLARQTKFDLIHAHDWLTFPSGILAKKVSGKPLVIHVHATDFDRSGGKANPKVYQIEKEGMDEADCIICVSNRTREMVIEKYDISPSKISTVHNGVEFDEPVTDPERLKRNREKIVTFLGRITLQKGPEYFIRVAEMVLEKMDHVRFIMAGSGDLLHEMIKKAARAGLGNKFLFTGFLKGKDVHRMLRLSDVFVMPSVSEPFGICPLEAMQCGVPTIISKQSGVSEVVKHAIKVDFWDVQAMADAIHGILSYPALFNMMKKEGKKEVTGICWEQAAQKIEGLYRQLLLSA